MSKFTVLKDRISGDNSIYLAELREERSQNCFREMSFIVAPKQSLHGIQELEEFTQRLVPKELEPTYVQPVKKTTGGVILGKMLFEEEIGRYEIKTIITDPDILQFNELNHVNIATRPLIARTGIYIFPDTRLADLAKEVNSGYLGVISLEEMEKINKRNVEESPVQSNFMSGLKRLLNM